MKNYKHVSYKWILNKITQKFPTKIWNIAIATKKKSQFEEKEEVEFDLGYIKLEVTQDT